MKRGNRFIIGLLAAGITFATLTATLGTEHWKRGYYYGHGYFHHYDHHHDYDNSHQQWKSGDPDKTDKNAGDNNDRTDME